MPPYRARPRAYARPLCRAHGQARPNRGCPTGRSPTSTSPVGAVHGAAAGRGGAGGGPDRAGIRQSVPGVGLPPPVRHLSTNTKAVLLSLYWVVRTAVAALPRSRL